MSGNDSTIDIIRAAQRGDTASWNLVYSRFYASLYATAVQRCKSVPVARDAVQDTFIIAYLKLSQLQEPAAFPGWIKRILLNTCFKANAHERSFESLDVVVRGNVNEIDDELEYKYDTLSRQKQLHHRLAALPVVLRTTLLLRYFFSFQSYLEIASILRIPVGTVRSRLNQSKSILTAQWRSNADEDRNAINEGEYWNQFYFQTLGGIHHDDCYMNRFMGHFAKNARVFRTGNDIPANAIAFGDLIRDDRRAGSRILPVQVMTSGNISIVESRHFNSFKNPGHCPDVSLMIIERCDEKARKMQLHVF